MTAHEDRKAAAQFISESDGDFEELSALFAKHRHDSTAALREALEKIAFYKHPRGLAAADAHYLAIAVLQNIARHALSVTAGLEVPATSPAHSEGEGARESLSVSQGWTVDV